MLSAGLFVLFYALYIIRIVRVGVSLNMPYQTVFIKLFLRSAMFALLVIALLGPSFGGDKKEVKSVGKDIMFCVDLSKSMDAFDVQPTRLEKIKFEMKKIVTAFNSDRLGVVIFSSEAFMQCPLTYDQNALNLFIESMNTSLVPSFGTDFGPALRMALQKLEEDEERKTQSTSKIIILISDGEDFGDDTKSVARDIEDKDIKLFALGIGTEEGGKIYANNGFKRDREGQIVITKLEPASLRSIADETGGQYFEINDSRNDVSRLINTIGGIEGEMREARLVDVTANKYFYFLAAALVLLLIDVLTNVKTIRI